LTWERSRGQSPLACCAVGPCGTLAEARWPPRHRSLRHMRRNFRIQFLTPTSSVLDLVFDSIYILWSPGSITASELHHPTSFLHLHRPSPASQAPTHTLPLSPFLSQRPRPQILNPQWRRLLPPCLTLDIRIPRHEVLHSVKQHRTMSRRKFVATRHQVLHQVAAWCSINSLSLVFAGLDCVLRGWWWAQCCPLLQLVL
jgi:hypothetical protein